MHSVAYPDDTSAFASEKQPIPPVSSLPSKGPAPSTDHFHQNPTDIFVSWTAAVVAVVSHYSKMIAGTFVVFHMSVAAAVAAVPVAAIVDWPRKK